MSENWDLGEPPLTDAEREYAERYQAAAHAMQTGVKYDMATDPDQAGRDADDVHKHLRTGVNAAMAEHSALVRLLMAKGVIGRAEYLEAVAVAMEAEKRRYEEVLSERYGQAVTLE